MLRCAKTRAIKRGLPFDITAQDITVPKVCPYLGLTLEVGVGKILPNSYSVDRIDNSKGYVKGNVEVISTLANKMKQNASREQLIAFAKGVLSKFES